MDQIPDAKFIYDNALGYYVGTVNDLFSNKRSKFVEKKAILAVRSILKEYESEEAEPGSVRKAAEDASNAMRNEENGLTKAVDFVTKQKEKWENERKNHFSFLAFVKMRFTIDYIGFKSLFNGEKEEDRRYV